MSSSSKNFKYCFNCAAEIDARAEICPKCGVRQPSLQKTEFKSPGLAAVLSFLIPGLGQIYCGKIGKGILFLVLAIVSAVLIIIFLIGIPIYIIVWVINILDAHKTAKRINEGLDTED
jgi:TM2 domain-containing membrane protein YozV